MSKEAPKGQKILFEFPKCPHQFGGWCIVCVRELVNAAREETKRNLSHTGRSVHSCEAGMERAYAKGFAEGVDAMAHAAADFCWDKENRKRCFVLAKFLHPKIGGMEKLR